MGSLDLRYLCSAGLIRLIKSGIFPDYENTGPFRPSAYQTKGGPKERELMILHYADLRGPLYQDRVQWKRAQSLLHGFTQPGSGITKLSMPKVWGTIPASFDSAKASLPSAFQVVGFDRADVDPGGRFWLFRAGGGTRTENLPEPYGKWYQHVDQRARWGQTIKLRLEVNCVLNYVSDETTSIALTPAVPARPPFRRC